RLPVLGDRSCRTVYLGAEGPALARLEPCQELDGLIAREVEVPLWGRLTETTRRKNGEPDTWIELRVPHRFHYPVSVSDRPSSSSGVKAILETWSDTRGELHFSRLCDLRE